MASWVTGYPIQKDRGIDLMYENESQSIWEELNKRDENWNKMLDSVGFINVALENISKAIHSMNHAKDAVEGIPSEYKLGSLLDDLEELNCNLNSLRERFINGEG